MDGKDIHVFRERHKLVRQPSRKYSQSELLYIIREEPRKGTRSFPVQDHAYLLSHKNDFRTVGSQLSLARCATLKGYTSFGSRER
jgi:hypothetical protein